MAWVELGRTVAVGLLGVGIHGAQIAPQFSDWPSGEDEDGCYTYYPDLIAREYQVLISCPNRGMGMRGVFES